MVQHARAADRFAHKIIGIRIMKASVPGDGEVALAYSGTDCGSKC
jgi:hypothetical protein